MPINKYKVGGLFSGVGGIELGFEQAGYEISWANEFDKNACITYRTNFPNHLLIEQDIWEIIDNDFKYKNEELGEIDILVGGFPCQAFSVAGYRKGFEDPRGNLFFAIVKFISHYQPKAILLENVKNLERHDGGKTFGTIYEELDRLGYSVIYKVMNTRDYTEIPQTRERIFIIGFKGESDFNNAELFRKHETPCSASFIFPEKTKKTKSIKQMLSKVKVDEKYYYTVNTYFWDEIKENMISRDTVYQWRRKYIRENKSNLCPTLTANMGMGGHNVPLVIDSTGGYRKLTPKECFRFQGFNNIKLPKISDSSLYKQAGNSVTVPLIERLAGRVKIALDSKYSNTIKGKDRAIKNLTSVS